MSPVLPGYEGGSVMIPAVECPACAATDFEMTDRGQIQGFVSYRTGVPAHEGRSCFCRRCGLWFSRARFTDDEISKLYADYRGESYNRDREMHEHGYTAQYAHLSDERAYRPIVEEWIAAAFDVPRTVLDIGGHDGINTPFREVADVTICEVGDEITGRFDLVVMAHVLEHASYPRAMVDQAFAALNFGGCVYAEVPIEENTDDWHEHVQKFAGRSLHYLFAGNVISYKEMDTEIGRVGMVIAGEA